MKIKTLIKIGIGLVVLVACIIYVYIYVSNRSRASFAPPLNISQPQPAGLWGGCFKLAITATKCYGANGNYLGFKRRAAGENSYPIDTNAIDGVLSSSSGPAFTQSASYMQKGYIHPNLILILQEFVKSHTITIGDGHQAEMLNLSRCCVTGTESQGANCPLRDHYTGSAIDIYGVDGIDVKSPDNQTIKQVIQWFIDRKSVYLIEQVGFPETYAKYFDNGTVGDGIFSNSAHYNHIHISFNWNNVCQ